MLVVQYVLTMLAQASLSLIFCYEAFSSAVYSIKLPTSFGLQVLYGSVHKVKPSYSFLEVLVV